MKVRHCQPDRFRSATTYLCFSSPHSGPNLSGWGHFLFASRSFAFPAWMSSLLARIGQAHDGRIGRSIESLACASTRYRSRRREIQQAPVFIDARFKGIEFPTEIKGCEAGRRPRIPDRGCRRAGYGLLLGQVSNPEQNAIVKGFATSQYLPAAISKVASDNSSQNISSSESIRLH
jgi:hypothetical protein